MALVATVANPASLLRAALFAALGAVTAYAANRRLSFFHDGLRPMVPQLEAGTMQAREFGHKAFQMSIGFILLFSAPVTPLTGVMVSHTIFLAADIAGAWFTAPLPATLSGLAAGGMLSLLLDALRYGLAALPNNALTVLATIPDLYLLVYFLSPAAVAIRFLGAKRGGLVLAATLLARLVANPLNSLNGGRWHVSAEAVAALAGALTLLYFATRRRNDGDDPLLAITAPNVARLRRAVVPLTLAGALAGALAQKLWFAAGPTTALVLARGRVIDAVVLALISCLSFGPLTINSARLVGAYTHQGVPEFAQAAGYLMPNPLLGAVAGAGVMASQLLGFGRLERLVHRYPDLSELGDAMRSGGGFADLTLAVGSLIAAQAFLPTFGPVLVITAYLLNEAAGRPMIHFVIAPYAAAVTAVIGAFVR
ncbi:MAG: YhfT family protein [Chloroflexota bacterium]